MQELLSLAAVIAALALGVASPGPSFVMVAKEAVARSRSNGLAAALGMGVGGVLFAGAALLGLQAVLLAVPPVYVALKVLGGLYLCWLGFRIFKVAPAPAAAFASSATAGRSVRRSFWLGLSTQVSNPKTAVVYASVFAALLPTQVSAILACALLLAVFCVEAGWYALVAAMLSSDSPRRAYLSFKVTIDRLAGLAMIALGVRLITSAAKS
jgi:threonine/homoserine/homoserine lactone efflux protein